MKKFMKKHGAFALVVLGLAAVKAGAVGVGTFDIDLTDVNADILAYGGAAIALAVSFLSYKWARKMLAR